MMEVLNHLSTLLLLSLLPPSLSHVVVKFSEVKECSDFFLEGTTPNLPGILVDGTVKDQNRYKPICQKYKDKYRFATLYDTTNKIPVFSAYTFTGPPPKGRPDQPWMIEPQLEDIKNIHDMKVDKNVKKQAADADYEVKIKNMKIHRGHLFPCSYVPDMETKKSTFTLTNVVPQASSFNQVSWRSMECSVRKTLQKDCLDNNGKIKAYVVTGAVPSKSNTLNNRVNIPSLLWTAYCCYNSTQRQWVAEAHWGENKKYVRGDRLPSNTLADLYKMLNQYYGDVKHSKDGVKVFPDDCQNGKQDDTGRNGEAGAGQKRSGEMSGESKGSIKRQRETGDEENDCDFDCDEE
ncbi:endonuclease domain-containing 1 protein-like [Coregonus clupeaformis]|uniref:endonuclease domain-containing 1 protein-like n=1 Tax=Coregonus clupeaformis TaxID=59861 RepID=UPI001E1C741E|nr:endonuclease domain-containing 1 protein-like [Coregonus clupeaformis]